MRSIQAALLTVALLFGAAACGSIQRSMKRPTYDALELAHIDYTNDVRWSNFSKLREHVTKEDRAELAKMIDRFKSIRITDFEVGPFDMEDEGKTARIEVMYDGYGHKSFIGTRIIELQEWYWHEEMLGWRLRPNLNNVIVVLPD